MPLLEVVQTRQISASVRLTDSTATQVNQYAAFIRASADDVVEQALAFIEDPFYLFRCPKLFITAQEAESLVDRLDRSETHVFAEELEVGFALRPHETAHSENPAKVSAVTSCFVAPMV